VAVVQAESAPSKARLRRAATVLRVMGEDQTSR
jgi:hypothetical protein